MRIAFNQNKFAIEKDDRVLKSNYGSRPEYSIELAILYKRLIYNNSKIINEITVYNMTNLEAFYDRQLAPIESIVEESMGVEQ